MNVTITITRKFLTILISNVAFGHHLSPMQWLGCCLVFSGLLAKPVLLQATKQASVSKPAVDAVTVPQAAAVAVTGGESPKGKPQPKQSATSRSPSPRRKKLE